MALSNRCSISLCNVLEIPVLTAVLCSTVLWICDGIIDFVFFCWVWYFTSIFNNLTNSEFLSSSEKLQNPPVFLWNLTTTLYYRSSVPNFIINFSRSLIIFYTNLPSHEHISNKMYCVLQMLNSNGFLFNDATSEWMPFTALFVSWFYQWPSKLCS